MRAELDRGALFSCQADVVKRICNTGPNLITIPDKWLLDLDMERDDSSDELLLSPNATFLSQQSGMKHTGGNSMVEELQVPIHLKMTLTIKKAAAYSNIGINKIESMLRSPNCPFVLYVGSKKLVKRREFEQYISHKLMI